MAVSCLVVVFCLGSLQKLPFDLGLLLSFFLPSLVVIGDLCIYFFRLTWSCLSTQFIIWSFVCGDPCRDMGKTIRLSFFIRKSSGNPKFFAFFFGEKNGLQKFWGMFYVLAALDNGVP